MFNKIRQDIYGVFASNLWENLGIRVFPENYQGDIGTQLPYIRLTIIPGVATLNSHNLEKQLSGRMVLSIFVDNNAGDKDLYELADIINDYFQGKTLTNGTQFGPSTLIPLGIDKINSSIYRGDYSITFKKYGE